MFSLQNIIFIVLGLIIFYLILYTHFSNKKLINIDNINNKKESFTGNNEKKITYDSTNQYQLTETEGFFFDHAFGETAIKGNELTNVPIVKDPPNPKDPKLLLYPIHMLLYNYKTENNNSEIDNYIYIALFNNGGLYKKDDIKQTHWEGPIRNSLVFDSSHKPLRNISLSHEGELLGITFEGLVYKKDKSKDLDKNYETKWTKIETFTDVKYLMTKDKAEDSYYVIKRDSKLYEKKGRNDPIIITTDNKLKINKIYKDYNDFILLLTDENKLYKSVDEINTIDTSLQIITEYNQTELVDIIYDSDKTLLGLGITEKGSTEVKKAEGATAETAAEKKYKQRFKTELLKQEDVYYLTDFKLLSEVNNNLNNVLSKNKIIELKNNYKVKEQAIVTDLDSLNDAQKNDDKEGFKKFCKERFGTTQIDLELENEIKMNEQKSESLKKIIRELQNDKYH